MSNYLEFFLKRSYVIIDKLLEAPVRNDLYEQREILRRHTIEIVLFRASVRDIFAKYGRDEAGNRIQPNLDSL